jgi:hypothetical protein
MRRILPGTLILPHNPAAGRTGPAAGRTGPPLGPEPGRGGQALAVSSASSSVKPRVLLGSTGIPGAIVVVKVIFFR